MRVPRIAIATLLAIGAVDVPAGTRRAATPIAAIDRPRDDGKAHDVHLTYSRIVVDGSKIQCRIRLFKDDLEKGLQEFSKSPALRVAATPAVDSLFAAYFNARASFAAGGQHLSAKVTESGPDLEATDPQMWWFTLEIGAAKPVRSLAVRIGLLFESFRDQKNIVTLIKMPGEDRHSLYFSSSDSKEQLLQWKD